ncbi:MULTISPECIES: DEAD/DEAH box helicase [unclassified Tolypothrix]|uniref:DEAD/DEAH box helicase n=1 Tax=unclassified Tolypothrix TaxID=2649714 RepID=UPI0005EABC25|nr:MULTISPECIES: DEAD/DEAH box helicase [unclassified Tolypothrix]BAY92577.1 DEAD/DEAH box helicase domain-containing protein [Microchaete diplosiphon NIES-3275]EKF05655.1 Superfamily II DNA/RNA helicase [Tolypothrix sp. PCC 7601]MBE9084030.1 DEAD/DEAH box helicase [Tolypothrix sp. LEGE 11397]UYD26530.1 DEAD/DEAH box helicase [Tolypothrix sp. PCC 7712]UYD31233.1 DEAD/DEAH box helicase [Tolypothrix sp. PCC 7601]
MNLSFQELGISQERVEQLEKIGFTTPTNIQTQAIPQLLAGRDVVGQSQTGTGKTAAFSLPILERLDVNQRAVQALVLTPTRELAMQVHDAIAQFIGDEGLRVLAIYGGQSIDRQILQLRRGVHMVVGTPGRVIDLLDRGCLKLDQVKWFVLDEADEMLSMGFIDDVIKILSQAPEERQTALFSATMPPSIRQLVNKFLRSPATVTVEQPKAAPTKINQVAYLIPRHWTKAKALQPILEMEDPESALIFVRTRRTAAELTSQLQAAGHSVDEYHGDLSQQARERLLSRFRNRQVRWVVATDIAARGLDVDQLSHVINYDLPDSVETYVHRIGRTGRAGKEGTAISLVQPFERRKQQVFERHNRQSWQLLSIPTRAQIEARHINKLQEQVREALAGERLASFLPIVSELIEKYDAQAIAAAALQIAYDQTRPAWLSSDIEIPQEDNLPTPKPKLVKQRRDGSGERSRSNWSKSDNIGEDERRSTPKPKLRAGRRDASPVNHKLGSSAARESAS